MEQGDLIVVLLTGLFLGITFSFYVIKAKRAWKKRKRKKKAKSRLPPASSRTYKPVTISDVPFMVADPLPMQSYNRDLFGPPISQKVFLERRTPRDTVLLRDGQDVKVYGDKIISGVWKCPYSGSVLTYPGEVEIDHVVPLAEAWRSGAVFWNSKQRITFGRATDNLVAVSKVANRAKSDSDISKWLPKINVSEYIISYLQVKYKYGMTLNKQEVILVNKYFGR